MTSYYNEIDPYAAQWLRNLINANLIAPGEVDTRSIVDVRPDDLAGFTQCHFFAGIGVWSYSLRLAEWPDDRPIWTGSCPCQPFSAAGKGGGFNDERHLWPAMHWLIQQCRPDTVMGEQVASSDGLAWLDLVQADLDATDYTSGAVDICSAGVGAPHIRQRLYWMAHSNDARLEGRRGMPQRADQCTVGSGGMVGGLADLHRDGRGQARQCEAEAWHDGSKRDGAAGGLADANRSVPQFIARQGSRPAEEARTRSRGEPDRRNQLHQFGLPGPTNGIWGMADWLFCRDGKWRPVEPGTSPLAHGAASRVGRLRAYGNAVNAQTTAEVIRAFMDCQP